MAMGKMKPRMADRNRSNIEEIETDTNPTQTIEAHNLNYLT